MSRDLETTLFSTGVIVLIGVVGAFVSWLKDRPRRRRLAQLEAENAKPKRIIRWHRFSVVDGGLRCPCGMTSYGPDGLLGGEDDCPLRAASSPGGARGGR
jgi:hypothetical protein